MAPKTQECDGGDRSSTFLGRALQRRATSLSHTSIMVVLNVVVVIIIIDNTRLPTTPKVFFC